MEKLTVSFNIYDAGCLSGLLEHRLDEARRRRRFGAAQMSPEQVLVIDEFISQMTNCLAAINASREAWARNSN